MKQRLSILGSTGSIGVQTLDIVAENPELFEVNSLVAGTNWQLLAEQAIKFDADSVVIADTTKYEALRDALAAYPIKVYTGSDAICQVVRSGEVDVVVNAASITDAQRAQIEDIVKRKTEVGAESIIITLLNLSE